MRSARALPSKAVAARASRVCAITEGAGAQARVAPHIPTPLFHAPRHVLRRAAAMPPSYTGHHATHPAL